MGKRRSLMDDPVARAVKAHGISNFTRALGFAAAWAVVAQDMGREPTLDEYQAWWKASERTSFRDQAAFRKVTGMDDPGPIWRRARAAGVEFDRDSAGRAAGMALLPYIEWSAS